MNTHEPWSRCLTSFSSGRRRGAVWFVAAAFFIIGSGQSAADTASNGFNIVELTVESTEEGLRSHRFTARQLAEACLTRIATYNPGYNAIITPNPNALSDADAVDRRRAAGEALGPLAGVPVVGIRR